MGKKVKKKEKESIIRFEDVITYDNLMASYHHVCKGKKRQTRVIHYHMEHPMRIRKLYNALVNETYELGPLTRFTVYEPKQREVIADDFEDKIVQDVIAKCVLYPLISRRVIYDNYASQPKKGTHKALKRLQRYMTCYAKTVNWENRGWVLSCDISKFFYTIDHDICWNMVKALPIDEKLGRLIKKQIDACTEDLNMYAGANKGLCIGFQTSQWLAVYYLNGMDHLIKEKLGIKYYGRYMDDFYLIHESREYLEYCFRCIQDFLAAELKMTLNPKSHIHPFSQGICFLGYHVTYDPKLHDTETTIRTKSINKMLRRTKKQVRLVKDGQITVEEADTSLNSWMAYAVHGNSEKAQNCYDMAKEMLHRNDPAEREYRRLRADWTNLDPDDFYLLDPTDDADLRCGKGFMMLQPRKTNKRDAWKAARAEEVLDRTDKYLEKNLNCLLTWDPRKRKRRTKGFRRRKRAWLKLGEAQRRLMRP